VWHPSVSLFVLSVQCILLIPEDKGCDTVGDGLKCFAPSLFHEKKEKGARGRIDRQANQGEK